MNWLRSNPSRTIIVVLLVFYMVGIIGLLSPFQPLFLQLTPFTLVLSFSLLLLQIPERNWNVFLFLLAAFVVGIVAEIIGVHYGFLFGDYAYGKTLGPKVMEVPWAIGLNWFMVIYSSAILASHLSVHWIVKAAATAGLAVVYDYIMEPVAMQLDFWQWAEGVVPLQNYIGWFLVSIFLALLFFLLRINPRNKIALPLLLIQLFFFSSLRLLL